MARPLDAILSAGTLNVGVNPNYPPTAMYNDKNELQGFDVDLSNKLGEMLGVKVNFVVVDPEQPHSLPHQRPHRHGAGRHDALCLPVPS